MSLLGYHLEGQKFPIRDIDLATEKRKRLFYGFKLLGPVTFVGKGQSGKRTLAVRLKQRTGEIVLSDHCLLPCFYADFDPPVPIDGLRHYIVIYFITEIVFLRGTTPQFFKHINNHSVVVFVFDVTNFGSFLSALNSLTETRKLFKRNAPTLLLVGNKIDLQVEGGFFTSGMARISAEGNGALYYECSATGNIGTKALLRRILKASQTAVQLI